MKANDTTPLVVINQTKPVYVVCSIPERYLAEIQDRMASGGLTVESNIPDTDLPPITGKVVFVYWPLNQARLAPNFSFGTP